MKTKSVNKLALSKEVVVLLNDKQAKLIGGETNSGAFYTRVRACEGTFKCAAIKN